MPRKCTPAVFAHDVTESARRQALEQTKILRAQGVVTDDNHNLIFRAIYTAALVVATDALTQEILSG